MIRVVFKNPKVYKCTRNVCLIVVITTIVVIKIITHVNVPFSDACLPNAFNYNSMLRNRNTRQSDTQKAARSFINLN